MVGICNSCGAHFAINEAGEVSPAKPPVATRTMPISFWEEAWEMMEDESEVFATSDFGGIPSIFQGTIQ